MSDRPAFPPGDDSAFTSIAAVGLGVRGHLLNLALRTTVKSHLRNLRTDASGVASMRQRVDQIVARFNRFNDDLHVEQQDIGGVGCEILHRDNHNEATVLYIHGGAFLACSPQSHWGITRPLALSGVGRICAVDYRLAPEYPFPSALDDVLAVYRVLLRQNGAGRIAIAGDSAGGNLVLSLLHAAKAAGLPMPACAVCLSPWTDLTGSGHSLRENVNHDPMLPADRLLDGARLYLGDAHPRDPLASPLYGNFRGFPPLLFHVGDTEILLDDTLRVVANARAAGVEAHLRIWPGFPHVFHVFSGHLHGARVALSEISDFIFAKLHAHKAVA